MITSSGITALHFELTRAALEFLFRFKFLVSLNNLMNTLLMTVHLKHRADL